MLKPVTKRLIFIILLIITVGGFLLHTYQFKNDIFKKFNSTYWTKRYQESQWVIPNSKNSIGDDGLYMYAGYRYVKGDDPTLLNAEIPPLGKYIIGILEIKTGYIGIFSWLIGALTLILFFVFNKTIFKQQLTALIPVTIFSFDPLFVAQLRAPYLDTIYLCFLLLGFTLLLNKKYILAGIAFGAFMATKSPFLVMVVYAAVLCFMLFTKNLQLKKMIYMVFATLLIFILSYTSTFLHGHSFLYFLKVQKYIVHFYATGAKGIVGAVIPMIFFDKWYTWYNSVLPIAEWTILWPVAAVGSLIALLMWLKKKPFPVLFHIIWIFLYLIFLIFTPIFARYLLLLLPFLYNLSIWSLQNVINWKYFLVLD